MGVSFQRVGYKNGYFEDEDEAEEFDKGFSYKEKLKLPGQLF